MECLHIPEIPYGEFSKRLHNIGSGRRLPLGISIELTERCNLRCAHCYINRPAGDGEAQKGEISVQQWFQLIDEMAAAGCLWLLLTGGEPLLHPGFREIYTHAKKRGMIINLFTNGTLITPDVVDFLQDWPPFMVGISIYGRTKATHEAVTRVPGSFDRCLQGIELLLEHRIPLELKAMVMTLNVHEIWDLKSWAESLGVMFRYDQMLNARLDGGQAPVLLRLPPEQAVELDMQDEKCMREWQRVATQLAIEQDSPYLYTCGAGTNTCHVDANGQMHPCMMSRTSGYDLTTGAFEEVWNEVFPKLLSQKVRDDYPCGRCNLINLCGQCPGWSLLEHGNPDTPVTYLCRLAHLRAMALGLNDVQLPSEEARQAHE
jgi:radical SAM protein with 4Fe4S-binding SPASM domain